MVSAYNRFYCFVHCEHSSVYLILAAFFSSSYILFSLSLVMFFFRALLVETATKMKSFMIERLNNMKHTHIIYECLLKQNYEIYEEKNKREKSARCANKRTISYFLFFFAFCLFVVVVVPFFFVFNSCVWMQCAIPNISLANMYNNPKLMGTITDSIALANKPENAHQNEKQNKNNRKIQN